MKNWTKFNNCTLFWWVVATVAGIAGFTATTPSTSVFVGLMLGAALFLLIGFAMTRLFCQGTGAGVMTGSRFTGPAVGSDTPAIARAAALAAMERRPVAPTAPAAAAFGAHDGAADATAKADPTGNVVRDTAPAPQAPDDAAPERPAARPETDATPDYDKDGVLEGTAEGTRPAALAGPRDGKADNLKEIKGIGPKLEELCHAMGFYHFDQIAAWTPDEVAWVNANLQGFKGRVTRDDWIAQAKILAAGGETEFSRRVEDGGVY